MVNLFLSRETVGVRYKCDVSTNQVPASEGHAMSTCFHQTQTLEVSAHHVLHRYYPTSPATIVLLRISHYKNNCFNGLGLPVPKTESKTRLPPSAPFWSSCVVARRRILRSCSGKQPHFSGETALHQGPRHFQVHHQVESSVASAIRRQSSHSHGIAELSIVLVFCWWERKVTTCVSVSGGLLDCNVDL